MMPVRPTTSTPSLEPAMPMALTRPAPAKRKPAVVRAIRAGGQSERGGSGGGGGGGGGSSGGASGGDVVAAAYPQGTHAGSSPRRSDGGSPLDATGGSGGGSGGVRGSRGSPLDATGAENTGARSTPAADAHLSWSEGFALALADFETPGDAFSTFANGVVPWVAVGHDHKSQLATRAAKLPSADPAPPMPPVVVAWLNSGVRAGRGVLALLLMGWRRRWRDGALRYALERYSGKLTLEQWPSLLTAAKHADGGAVKARVTKGVAAGRGRGRGDDSEGEEDEEDRGGPTQDDDGDDDDDAAAATVAADDGSSLATLLVLRGMLSAQPPSVCLGLLRRQPSLAARLPPRGYVELLHAVRREAATEAEPEEASQHMHAALS